MPQNDESFISETISEVEEDNAIGLSDKIEKGDEQSPSVTERDRE